MKQGQRGCCPFPLHPKSPLESSSASLRIIALDDSEHLLHNHHASVASLRLLFTFVPECRSASLRNQRSPSPEYPPAIQVPGGTLISLCRDSDLCRVSFLTNPMHDGVHHGGFHPVKTMGTVRVAFAGCRWPTATHHNQGKLRGESFHSCIGSLPAANESVMNKQHSFA